MDLIANSQLCGPKCTELKVNQPERFHYDPKKTIQQVISVYLNLNSDKFAEFVAFEEVLN
jgi:ubiquitin conjugation factor E4 B